MKTDPVLNQDRETEARTSQPFSSSASANMDEARIQIDPNNIDRTFVDFVLFPATLTWWLISFTWNVCVSILTGLSALILSPTRYVVFKFLNVVSPFWRMLSWAYSTVLDIIDELWAPLMFLLVGALIGAISGLVARVICDGMSHVVEVISSAIREAIGLEDAAPAEKRRQGSISSHASTPGLGDTDFSFSEDDPLPPYLTGTARQRAVPMGTLVSQTIHEELEDSDSA